MNRRDYDSERRRRSPVRSRRSRSRSPRPTTSRGYYPSRRRSRSRSGERRRSRSRERRNRSPRVEDIVGNAALDKEEKQKHLELEMQKRREKVEKWRLEQAKKKQNELFENPTPQQTNVEDESKKKWSLENDSDENDSEEYNLKHDSIEVDDSKLILPTNHRKEDEKELMFIKKIGKQSNESTEMDAEQETVQAEKDDVDPLDLYMEGIENEMKKTRGSVIKKQEKVFNDKKISIITGVAKKKQPQDNKQVKKGELLEQNQDALEYSSEDEATDDLHALNNNLMSTSKTKKLTSISKDDITYMPFEKCFYVEVSELAQMTPEEVEKLREDLEGIKVKGKGCPKPIKHWSHCGVSKKIFDSLKRYGYEKPTPIQAQAIPAIMSGRDIIGIAKTGSGKTMAFLLPMFRHILAQPPLNPGDGPIAIIMTPTRELATQISSECKKFTKYIGLRVVAVYGGTPISAQIGELKTGAEIVVCTPGRMIDMLAANSGRVINLRRCTYLVLDEADRMFDLGFEPQVTRIIDGIRPDRQTVVFSATFPRVMETLARRILNRPIEISVGGRSIVCKDIEQHVLVIEEEDKFRKLLEILGRHLSGDGQKSAIVFVDKQENADFLLKELMHAMYSCLTLHGGIDQTDRDSTIADFKANKVNVLVATSVAARGLDIKHCIVVVNYDCPNHYEDYVHRCGRTGRAGNKGFAYTFITPDQGKFAFDINKALELSDYPRNEELVALFNNYKSRQEALGRTVMAGGSGFSGKGFKFNEQEAQLANEKRRFQKVALGLQDSDDEDTEDMDKVIENMLESKKPKPQTQTSTPTTTITTPQQTNPTNGIANGAPTSNLSKIELAKKLASKINVNLASKVTSNTEAFLKGETNIVQMSAADTAKSLAERRAEAINMKLNYIPRENDNEQTEEQVKEDQGVQRCEDELEINDFPQQARWRVTHKDTIAQIAEFSGAGVTVRGTYVPEGKRYNPELGERKLYLAIEGPDELAVDRAKGEIRRIIKEEILKLQLNKQPANKSRYKV